MAEALFKAYLRHLGKNLEDWQIQSAGLWADKYSPATLNTQTTLHARDLDISSHLSQPITEKLLSSSNLILCMTKDHKHHLRQDFPEYARRIFLLSEMTAKVEDISDPIGLTQQDYERTADIIDSYLSQGMQKIINLAKSNH